MSSIQLTVDNVSKSVSVELVDRSPATITNIRWNFGDGTIVSGGAYPGSTSHTYTNYGNYPITCSYTAEVNNQLSNQSTTTSLPLTDPLNDDNLPINNTTYDAFHSKPIIIPADCTGDITITAMVEELDKPINSDKAKMSSTISAYANVIDINIPGSSTVTMIVDQNNASGVGTVSDSDLSRLEFIPAFYQSGQLNIQYTIGETEDEDSAFDIVWDLKMDMPNLETDCPWMEGNFSTSSQIFKNLISSDCSEANFPTATNGTTVIQTFNIGSWSELPPFVVKEFVDSPATDIMIKRAMLTPPRFYISITNKLASAVTLYNAKCVWTFGFNPTDIFMNMRTEGDRRKKQQRLYTLPKGSECTRYTDLNFPVYAVVDGYKKETSTRAAEIVKVFASWNEFHTDDTDGYYFPTTVVLEPVSGMSGTDFPTCLYKSVGYPMKPADFTRVTDGGWMDSDYVNVLDAPTIAESEHYRIIDVKVKDYKNPDDQLATFVITTTVNDSVDDKITINELSDNVEKLHFFNTTYSFATQVEIPRTAIDPMYYETLWQTYDKAAVLESIMEEPLYYVKFSINDYAKTIPIYNNGSLKFSDSLAHAADGVRSGDIFIMDGKTPNIINIQNPTKHKYKVKFKCDYQVYKDVYIVTNDDIPEQYRRDE